MFTRRARSEIIPPNRKDVTKLTYVYANGLKIYHGGTNNIKYVGTEGELPGGKAKPVPADFEMEGYRGRGSIFGDFVHCVKTRERAFRDIEIAHRATTVCHLGNIAYWPETPAEMGSRKGTDHRRFGSRPLARPSQARRMDDLEKHTLPLAKGELEGVVDLPGRNPS